MNRREEMAEDREIRKRCINHDFLKEQPLRIRKALEALAETGDLYFASRIAGLKLEEMNELRINKGEYPSGLMICVIIELTERELSDVRALMRRVDENPEMPAIDFPEATAILYAKKYRIRHSLTENKGAKAVPAVLNDFSVIKIWTALNVLKEATSKGILTDFEKALEDYSTETKHLFKRKW